MEHTLVSPSDLSLLFVFVSALDMSAISSSHSLSWSCCSVDILRKLMYFSLISIRPFFSSSNFASHFFSIAASLFVAYRDARVRRRR